MKKLMIAALAVASCTAFADHAELSAPMSGFYDVQITAKRLTHATKTVTKTWTTKASQGVYALDLYENFVTTTVPALAGYKEISCVKTLKDKTGEATKENISKITLKYTRYDFKEVTAGSGKSKIVLGTNYITKVVTDNLKGVYDAKDGRVYTWSTASANKVTVKADQEDAIVPSKKDKYGNEKDQKGFKAYEVPLAMHGQFIKTDDNKAAGGFTGGFAEAEDGTSLDFSGMTAFGTGTFNSEKENSKGEVTRKARVKTVSGNIAGKYEGDLKYGCYGTWKINLDANSAKYADLKAALVKKGCVELINEAHK